ncbi:sterol-sensing domain of SREBP cleavage-activation-domain-containing protein [Pilobolus umbonatus]|nr:sterol-sensing domain of SREBP cleavage-activation-domain-containing protein [Pilobolus umbonatus]
MALISPKALSNELSKNYYHYGKAVASRTYLLLFLSLSFISYFSYPILLKARYNTSSIPLPYLDGQSWQASPHIQISNFTVLRHPPTNYLIIQQIRLSYPDQPVDLDLFNKALQLYETIGSTVVSVDRLPPASLATICFKHQGDCLVQRPPDNIDDLTAPTLPYFHHPLSTMANISYNPQGQINKADGVILTYILNHDHDTPTLRIWNAILSEVKLKLNILDIQLSLSSTDSHPAIWYTLSDIVPHMIHYKYKLFPYYLSSNVQLSIVVYIAILYWVSNAFGKSNLVRSGLTFGLAAVFLSIACFTTTWGILDKLGISLHSVPWYLLLLAVNVSSLENILLLTTAILSAGCDMIVKEKISRGLQSAGVPMTATLIAELLILSVGTTMDVQLIKEFCMFVQLALLVDFILEMTFVIAILSIDIKRVEVKN